jgi:FkbM family methyltransferase
MLKRMLRPVLRAVGLDVIRYRKPNKKSLRTKRLTLHQTNTGNYYLPTDAFGDVVANTIIAGDVFEKEVVELAAKFIKPGTTVLDVGANFGQMSNLFANMVGKNGKVYSFEADDFVYEILNKNIAVNHNSEIVNPVFGAVYKKAGEVVYFPEQDFAEFDSYGSYGIDFSKKNGREVKTVSVDSLNIQTPISFMKIDIQGGDLEAMMGAVKTIEKNRMPILFEYEYHFEERLGMNFQQYVDFVLSIGYRFDRVITGHNFLILPK